MFLGECDGAGAQYPTVISVHDGTDQLDISREVSVVQGLCSKACRREVRRMKEAGEHVLSRDGYVVQGLSGKTYRRDASLKEKSSLRRRRMRMRVSGRFCLSTCTLSK